MRRFYSALAAAGFVIAAMAPTAWAAGTVDQEQPTHDGFVAYNTSCIGQTFSAGMSGRLDRISLYARNPQGYPVLTVEIRTVDASGPDGIPHTLLATSDVSGGSIGADFSWIDVPYDPPVVVLAGAQYAFTVVAVGPMGPVGPDGASAQSTWGFEFGGASQTVDTDPYPGGRFVSATSCDGHPYGVQSSDFAFRTYVDADGATQPDGRIRVNHGSWAGADIYNATAEGQWRTGRADPRNKIVFRVGIQNDGFLRDRFVVNSACTGNLDSFRLRYFRGTSEITAAVKGGTYRTPWMSPGARMTLEAWVKVKAGAGVGARMECLISLVSAGNSESVDAVGFSAARR
jgi:hypothetical protein